jgi:hypothetical protein
MTPSTRILALLIAFGACSVVRSAPVPPPREGDRLPLDAITVSFGQGDKPDDLPFAIVGKTQQPPLKDLATAYCRGQRPAPPGADAPCGLFLVGPWLNSGQHWQPVELRRRGDTFIVVVEYWHDNLPRSANVITRPACIVPLTILTPLPSGTYRVEIVERTLLLAAEGGAGYQLEQVRRGAVDFRVFGKGEPLDRKEAVLGQADLKPVGITADETKRRWQPASGVLEFEYDADQPKERRGVRAGSLPNGGYPRVEPGKNPLLPELGDARPYWPVLAAIMGPTLDTGERMTVRSVEWRGRTAVVNVEVWRDEEARKQNLPQTPLLLLPLRSGPFSGPSSGDGPVEYEVKVEWTFLRATNHRGPYRPEKPTGPWVNELLERSTAKFTVQPR